MGHSCAGYDVSLRCAAVYEERTLHYAQTFAIKKMQEEALNFIEDIKTLFGEHMELFTAPRDYYSILLYSMYSYPRQLDQKIFAHLKFKNPMDEDYLLVQRWNELTTLDKTVKAPLGLLKNIAYHFAAGGLNEMVKSKLRGHRLLFRLTAFAYRAARKVLYSLTRIFA